MASTATAGTKRAAGALFLAILSALPYAIVYGLDRVFEAPHAAQAALWPAAVVPVLVAALVVSQLRRDHGSRRAQRVVVRPSARGRV